MANQDELDKRYLAMAKEWSKVGADIIGGCCRIGPEHIRQLGSAFAKSAI